jgi:RNA polymerase sigma factor (sigma-70 family)
MERLASRLLLHRDALFGYLLVLLRNWDEAEEVFQEVCVVVLEKERDGLIVERFLPWCREIARRVVLRHWRRRSKTPRSLSPEVMAAIDQAFSLRDAEEERHSRTGQLVQAVKRCLKRLPDHLRAILDLFYRDSLSLGDIAHRLGRTEGAVQVALSRTRMRLAECARVTLAKEEGSSP